MALKIRLRSQGAKNRVTYRLVVTDSRSPRDGKYLEAVGWFNPLSPKEQDRLLVKEDRIQHWINCGAELSESVESLVTKAAPTIVQALKVRRQKAAVKRRQRRAAKA